MVERLGSGVRHLSQQLQRLAKDSVQFSHSVVSDSLQQVAKVLELQLQHQSFQ